MPAQARTVVADSSRSKEADRNVGSGGRQRDGRPPCRAVLGPGTAAGRSDEQRTISARRHGNRSPSGWGAGGELFGVGAAPALAFAAVDVGHHVRPAQVGDVEHLTPAGDGVGKSGVGQVGASARRFKEDALAAFGLPSRCASGPLSVKATTVGGGELPSMITAVTGSVSTDAMLADPDEIATVSSGPNTVSLVVKSADGTVSAPSPIVTMRRPKPPNMASAPGGAPLVPGPPVGDGRSSGAAEDARDQEGDHAAFRLGTLRQREANMGAACK
ncbi:MAG: hypothetical protein NZ523_05300 [Elioraea sp.]|nr:hypothetical protein [Elioraea sp.]